LSICAFGQSHTFPALDTNNTFTGLNTFTLTTTFGDVVINGTCTGTGCASGGGGGYATIQNASIAITQRTILNVLGALVCTDNAGTLASDCKLATNAAVSNQYLTGIDASGNFLRKQIAYGELSGVPQLAITKTAVASNWLRSYDSTTGLFTASQPAYTDITGTPTLPATLANATHKWLNSYSSVTGLFTQTQPDYTDLTSLPQLAVTKTAVASNWLLSYDSTTGLFTSSQPAFTDLSGVGSCAQEPALTGDVTSVGCATTLATVATPGTGLKSTINAKGLTTAVTTAQASDLTDGTTGIGNIVLASNGDINPKTLSNTRFAAAFAGADWCAKVAAASTAAGAGGTINMDGIAGGSACAAGFTLLDSQVLKFTHQGFFNIGTVSITLGNDSGIVCEDSGTVIVYTGSAFLINIASVTRAMVKGCGIDLNSAAPLGAIKISSTTNVSETRVHIKQVYLEAPTRTVGQIGILIQSDNATASPYHNELNDIQCEQMDICIRMNSLVNNQGPNANLLSGIKCNGESACIQMADGTDNILSNILCLQGGGGSVAPVCLDLGNSTNGYGVGNNRIDFSSEMGTGSTGVKIASGVGKTIGNGNMLITGQSNDVTQITDNSGKTTNTIILPTQHIVGSSVIFNQSTNKLGQADIVADSAAINTTETIIVKTPALAANRLIAGTHIRMTLTGTCTTTAANTSTFTIRMGTNGTTADTAIATPVTGVAGTTGTSIPFKVVIDFTVRTGGASGTGFITLSLDSNGLTGIVAAQTPAIIMPSMSTFNTTTASNILSVSYKSAATTTTSTFKQATIEFVQN